MYEQYQPRPIFNGSARTKADFILSSPECRFSSLTSKEVDDLAVMWSFYSAKIEDNAYSLAETQALLIDGIAADKPLRDTSMLNSLYDVFSSLARIVRQHGPQPIDRDMALALHSTISAKLPEDAARSSLCNRSMLRWGKGNTAPSSEQNIRACFELILEGQEAYDDPLEKAVYLYCNLSHLQMCISGNEYTSRTVESLALMNADVIPLYSIRAQDIEQHCTTLMHYYETGEYGPYVGYFLDRQLRRVLDVLPMRDEQTRNRIERILAPERAEHERIPLWREL